MHYLIKQEKCDKCDGNGRHTYYERSKPEIAVTVSCNCVDGYIETRVDADEWLEQKLKELGVTFETNAYVQHVRWQKAEGEK